MTDGIFIILIVAFISLAVIVYMISDLIVTREHTKSLEALESTMYEMMDQNQKQLTIHKRDMELIKYELRNRNSSIKVGEADGKH